MTVASYSQHGLYVSASLIFTDWNASGIENSVISVVDVECVEA